MRGLLTLHELYHVCRQTELLPIDRDHFAVDVFLLLEPLVVFNFSGRLLLDILLALTVLTLPLHGD